MLPETIKDRLKKVIADKAWTDARIAAAIDVHVATGGMVEADRSELFALMQPEVVEAEIVE